LARFFAGVAQGMALMAKVSTDPSLIRDIAKTAMQAWPDSRGTPERHGESNRDSQRVAK
jgi:hypothetical protein